MRRRKTPARVLPMLMLAPEGFARPPLPDKVKGTQGFPNESWTAESGRDDCRLEVYG